MISSFLVALLAASDLQVLEAVGEAPVSMGFTQAAQRAKDAALRQIVLKACKQAAAADPSVTQCAVADDRLFAGFDGLVTKLETVSQEQVGDAVRVKLRAEISLKAVSTDEREAQRLYQRLGRLSVTIDVPEQLVDGDRRVPTVSLLATRLSDVFRGEGWKIFPVGEGRADFAIVGQAISERLPPEPADLDKKGNRIANRARVKGTLEILDVAADRKVGKLPFEFSGADPSHFEHVAAGIIGREAPGLAIKLRAALVKALREAEARGAEVALTISGLKTEEQANALIERLQKVTGVLALEPGPLADGSMRLVVKSNVPAKDLARTLAKALGDKLSISSVRASAIDGTAK